MPVDEKFPSAIFRRTRFIQSPLVSKFINCVMSDGKRSTAERIIYKAFDIVKEKERRRSAEGLQEGDRQRQAEPRGEVAPRRRLELPGAGRSESEPPAVAEHPLDCGYARARGDGKTMYEKLANESSTPRTCAAAR